MQAQPPPSDGLTLSHWAGTIKSLYFPLEQPKTNMAFQKSSFGKSLRKMRKAGQLSQAELGDKLGVTQQTVGKWENELAFPSVENLEKLQEILGPFWNPDEAFTPREAARIGSVQAVIYDSPAEDSRPAYDSMIEEHLAAGLPGELLSWFQGEEARKLRVDYASGRAVIEFKWLGRSMTGPAIETLRAVLWKLDRLRARDTTERDYYLVVVSGKEFQRNLHWHEDMAQAMQEAVDSGLHLYFVNDSSALPNLVQQIESRSPS